MESICCNAMKKFCGSIRVWLEKVYQHLEVLLHIGQVAIATCMNHGLLKISLWIHLRVQIASQLALLQDLLVCSAPEGRSCLFVLQEQAIIDAVQILQLITRFLVMVNFSLGLLFLDQFKLFNFFVIRSRYKLQAGRCIWLRWWSSRDLGGYWTLAMNV